MTVLPIFPRHTAQMARKMRPQDSLLQYRVSRAKVATSAGVKGSVVVVAVALEAGGSILEQDLLQACAQVVDDCLVVLGHADDPSDFLRLPAVASPSTRRSFVSRFRARHPSPSAGLFR
ncbi:hypothetical protein Cni_G18988 [Canna indica]|uniref:Uncharacterized protein n=1 Tax=Canna indica TaxID=4628 RepID=A0AAQ3KLD5_9LILI|nr:hypothetical protein Cni_G18988 [Canna indica]